MDKKQAKQEITKLLKSVMNHDDTLYLDNMYLRWGLVQDRLNKIIDAIDAPDAVAKLRQELDIVSKTRATLMENFVTEFLNRTGIKIEDAEMIEEVQESPVLGLRYVWSCRRRHDTSTQK